MGGELRSAGEWPVAVELPAETLMLKSGSLSTSGTYRQFRPAKGPDHHLIDPRTGYPVAHHTVTVSVLAADSLTADSWATALNVLGVAEGLPLANRLGLAARFVTEEPRGHPRITRSDAWDEEIGPYLWSPGERAVKATILDPGGVPPKKRGRCRSVLEEMFCRRFRFLQYGRAIWETGDNAFITVRRGFHPSPVLPRF